MAQQLNQTVRATFNKGLLTEVSELNFPSEASIDELNCVLSRDGSRSRRLGIEYEENNQLSSTAYTSEGILYGTHTWTNVGEDPGVQFTVVQIGTTLIFYQRTSGALSASPVNETFSSNVVYEVDLNTYGRSGGLGAGQAHVDVASIQGALVVVSPEIEAFYIERNATTGAFTETQIEFKTRDFVYQTTDKRTLSSPVATGAVTIGRKYDTKNCGWAGGVSPESGDEALDDYLAAESEYPPLTAPWYVGKSSGSFSVSTWKKTFGGNTLITNGHYVLDLFNQDREAASGVVGVESTVIEERFSTVASFAGRVFFSGVDSRVYFSQILQDIRDIGDLYQVNDPTAQDFSDLLDTDGGNVKIPDAAGISKLHTFGASLLVFATNGVWRITGVDGVFRASEYSVYKVTDEGLSIKRSFVSGQNGVPFWWSYVGIHTVEVTDEGGMVERNISRDTIQTFWDNISGDSKGFCTGVYEEVNDRVIWLYPNEGETKEYKLNRLLFLDVPLGAFYPWEIKDSSDLDGPHIMGASSFTAFDSDEVEYTVVDSNNNTVINSGLDPVVVLRKRMKLSSSAIKFLTKDANGYLTFSEVTSKTFLDWGETNYSSYADSAYNFMGDLGRRKNSPFITVMCRTTEEGWTDEGSGEYSPIRGSSILVSSFWDFKKIPSSTAQQGYRYKHPLFVDPSDLTTFNYPTDVIATRLKLRGRGRVVRVRFESEQGKDFNLLGWETLDARNSGY